MKKVNQLIWFDYTEDGPDCSFHVDGRDGKFLVKAGKPAEAPDLTMSLTADNAHLSWANKLNPVMAITRGQIKVKGSATGLAEAGPQAEKGGFVLRAGPQGFWLGGQAGEIGVRGRKGVFNSIRSYSGGRRCLTDRGAITGFSAMKTLPVDVQQ